jgi:hypothetical protein
VRDRLQQLRNPAPSSWLPTSPWETWLKAHRRGPSSHRPRALRCGRKGVIGKRFSVPAVSKSAEEVVDALGFIGQVLAMDAPSSSKLTQERLGWRPTQPGLSPISREARTSTQREPAIEIIVVGATGTIANAVADALATRQTTDPLRAAARSSRVLPLARRHEGAGARLLRGVRYVLAARGHGDRFGQPRAVLARSESGSVS